MKTDPTKISKAMSHALRHDPSSYGLTLTEDGWTDVQALVTALREKGFGITKTILEQIVSEDSKGRYSLRAHGTQVRANQGHSVRVDLGMTAVAPPETLYHGTGDAVIGLIMRDGILKMKRHHVHLSADFVTACTVGRRHRGHTIVFNVDAQRMFVDGYKFYQSDNGVWLTEKVPVGYFSMTD